MGGPAGQRPPTRAARTCDARAGASAWQAAPPRWLRGGMAASSKPCGTSRALFPPATVSQARSVAETRSCLGPRSPPCHAAAAAEHAHVANRPGAQLPWSTCSRARPRRLPLLVQRLQPGAQRHRGGHAAAGAAPASPHLRVWPQVGRPDGGGALHPAPCLHAWPCCARALPAQREHANHAVFGPAAWAARWPRCAPSTCASGWERPTYGSSPLARRASATPSSRSGLRASSRWVTPRVLP